MKAVDLFCGCGGLSLGFGLAGFEVVAAYDNWKAALDVYAENLRHPAKSIDLSDVEAASKEIIGHGADMIIGGPPCQDFSSAGLRNEDNGRGDLTVSYARIIAAVRPAWFVMENVPAICKTEKLRVAMEHFRKCGYGLTQKVLNAALCGVPQKRKRYFLIGSLDNPDDVLLPYLESKLSAKEMTVKDYFGDRIDVEHYYRHPRSYARRGVFSVNEPSPTIRGVNRPLPKGYTLRPNDPVRSLDGIRELTTRERSMIQTFPETFRFFGTKSEIEQMIGNAVPVNLGRFVASAIRAYVADHPASR